MVKYPAEMVSSLTHTKHKHAPSSERANARFLQTILYHFHFARVCVHARQGICKWCEHIDHRPSYKSHETRILCLYVCAVLVAWRCNIVWLCVVCFRLWFIAGSPLIYDFMVVERTKSLMCDHVPFSADTHTDCEYSECWQHCFGIIYILWICSVCDAR